MAISEQVRRKPPLGVIARPGGSLRNKTGSWGIFNPVFNCDLCKGCRTCESICPEGCIRRFEQKQFAADLEFCKGCGLCAAACPSRAITMIEEHD